MILDCVLTAVNEKPLYLDFVPIFIKTWNKLYPNVDIKIIVIAEKYPNKLLLYKKITSIPVKIPKKWDPELPKKKKPLKLYTKQKQPTIIIGIKSFKFTQKRYFYSKIKFLLLLNLLFQDWFLKAKDFNVKILQFF